MPQIQLSPAELGQLAARRDEFAIPTKERALVDKILGAVPPDQLEQLQQPQPQPEPGTPDRINHQAAYEWASRGSDNPAEKEAFVRTYLGGYFGMNPSLPSAVMTHMVFGRTMDVDSTINQIKTWSAKVTAKDDPYDKYKALPPEQQAAEAWNKKRPRPSLMDAAAAAGSGMPGEFTTTVQAPPQQALESLSPAERKKLMDEYDAELRASSPKHRILDGERRLPEQLRNQVRLAVATGDNESLSQLYLASGKYGEAVMALADAYTGAYDGSRPKLFEAFARGSDVYAKWGDSIAYRGEKLFAPLQGRPLYENLLDTFKGKLPSMVTKDGEFTSPEAEAQVRQQLAERVRHRLGQKAPEAEVQAKLDGVMKDFRLQFTTGQSDYETSRARFKAKEALTSEIAGETQLGTAIYGATGMLPMMGAAIGAEMLLGPAAAAAVFASNVSESRDRAIFEYGMTPAQSDAWHVIPAVVTGLLSRAAISHQVPMMGKSYAVMTEALSEGLTKAAIKTTGSLGGLVLKRGIIDWLSIGSINEAQAAFDTAVEYAIQSATDRDPSIDEAAANFFRGMAQRWWTAAVFAGPKVAMDSVAAGIVGRKVLASTSEIGSDSFKVGDPAKVRDFHNEYERITGQPFDGPADKAGVDPADTADEVATKAASEKFPEIVAQAHAERDAALAGLDGQGMPADLLGEPPPVDTSIVLGPESKAATAIGDMAKQAEAPAEPAAPRAPRAPGEPKPASAAESESNARMVEALKAKFPALAEKLAVEKSGPQQDGAIVEGSAEGGKATVYTDAVQTPEQLLAKAAHELGHVGVDNVGEQLNPQLQLIADMVGREKMLQGTGFPEFYANLDDIALAKEHLARIAEKLIDGEKLDVAEQTTWSKIQDWASDRLGVTTVGELQDRTLARFMRGVLRNELLGERQLFPSEVKARQMEMAFSARPDGMARIPELQQGIRDRMDNKITQEEYNALVERYLPIRKVTEIKQPTAEQAKAAINETQRLKWQAHRELLQPGDPVGVRIDISAFKRTGWYVTTIHESGTKSGVGKVVGYDNIAKVSDARFDARSAEENSRIGSGEINKFPIATVEGKYQPIGKLPDNLLTDYTQVGFNPERHNYFYDKETGAPIAGGREAIMVGSTVFVKDPVAGSPESVRYSARPAPDATKAAAVSLAYRIISGDAVDAAKAEELQKYFPEADMIKALARAEKLATGKVAKGNTPAALVHALRVAELDLSTQERIVSEMARVQQQARVEAEQQLSRQHAADVRELKKNQREDLKTTIMVLGKAYEVDAKGAVQKAEMDLRQRAESLRRSISGEDQLAEGEAVPTLDWIIRQNNRDAFMQGKATGFAESLESTLDDIISKREKALSSLTSGATGGELRMLNKGARTAALESDWAKLQALKERFDNPGANDHEVSFRETLRGIYGDAAFERIMRSLREGKQGKDRERVNSQEIATRLTGLVESRLKSSAVAEVIRLLGRPESLPENLSPMAREAYQRLVDGTEKTRPWKFAVDQGRKIVESKGKATLIRELRKKGVTNLTDVEKAMLAAEGVKIGLGKFLEGEDYASVADLRDQLKSIVFRSERDKDIFNKTRRDRRTGQARTVRDEVMQANPALFGQGDRTAGRRRSILTGAASEWRMALADQAARVSGGYDTILHELVGIRPRLGDDAAKLLYHQLKQTFMEKADELGVARQEWELDWKRDTREVRIGGQRLRLNTQQIMDLYLLAKDPANVVEMTKARIKTADDRGGQYGVSFENEKDAAELIGAMANRELSNAQRALADHMQAAVTSDEVQAGLNATSMATKGTEEYHNKNYWGRSRDTSDSAKNPDIELDPFSGPRSATLETSSATHRRVSNRRDILLGNAVDKYFDHADWISKYTHLTLPLSDALAVLRDPGERGAPATELSAAKPDRQGVAQAIRERFGDKIRVEMGTTLNIMAGNRPETTVDKATRTLIGLVAVGKIGARATSMLTANIGGRAVALAELAHSFGKAEALEFTKLAANLDNPVGKGFFSKENEQAFARIMTHGFLVHRFDDVPTSVITQAYKPGVAGPRSKAGSAKYPKAEALLAKGGYKLSQMREMAMWPLVKADIMTAVLTYRALRNSGYSDAKAIEGTAMVIRRTQPPSSAVDETATYRGLRSAWMFAPFLGAASQSAAMFQRGISEWAMARTAAERQTALRGMIGTVVAVLGTATTLALVNRSIRAANTGQNVWPSDELEQADIVIKASTEAVDGLAPGVGRLLQMAASGVLHGNGGGTTAIDMELNQIWRASNLLFHSATADYGEGPDLDSDANIKKFINAGTALTTFAGVPLAGPVAAGMLGWHLVNPPKSNRK